MSAEKRLKAEIIQEAMQKETSGHLSIVRWPSGELKTHGGKIRRACSIFVMRGQNYSFSVKPPPRYSFRPRNKIEVEA
jgi:hypothetical protein